MFENWLSRRHLLAHTLAGGGVAGATYLGLTHEVHAEARSKKTEQATNPKLNTYDDNWVTRGECDIELVEWLDQQRITDASVYHFGTGGHHYVGTECAKPARRISVLGITASPQEYQNYVRLVTRRPEVLRYYNAVFGDIYLLNEKLLPSFDLVTLFHICEFRGPQTDAYGGMTDLAVTNLLTDKTRPGGYIFFYTSSFAFDKAKPVIAQWEKERPVERIGDYKSILVYRKAA
ncbi:MAG: hypothetical protein K2Y71_24580 [Xanthobacteraceae bacterium]|nr:hypothetical protein [Xanthobacteraceae bacterium]